MATLSNNSSNKRIRRDTYIQLQLSDLPQGILPKVASYLSNTSCVSFAMSLTSDLFSHEPSAISTAIINASLEGWESVDFKDIQDIYGPSLTDNDVRWVLFAIDGVNKIKSLKFTNCVEITGIGLQPLTGSTVLERIDLSLVGDHENPMIDPEPPISADLVVPILNSIIEREDNVFEHVQLPKKWREGRSAILTQFLQRFDRVLTGRSYQCSECEDVCKGEGDDIAEMNYQLAHWKEDEHKGYERYGIIGISCYQCNKRFCIGCSWDCDFEFCMYCDKFYCNDCNYVKHCQGSCPTCHQASSCAVCDKFKDCGGECDCQYCPECEPNWVNCQFCDEHYCETECSGACLYVCEGNGCNRSNCNGRYDTCFDDNKQNDRCVRAYKDHPEDEEYYSFCHDCYVGGKYLI